MNFSPMRIGPVRILLVLNLLLAVGLAWMWVDEKAQPRNISWMAPRAMAPDLKAPTSVIQNDAINAAMYEVILQRPLFAPDRKPPPPPAPPPPPDPLANVHIHGIFIGTDAGILARIDGKMRRIKVNDAVGPWTLKGVDDRVVSFVQGQETRQLRLDYARLNGPVPPPVQQTNANTAAPPPAMTENPAPNLPPSTVGLTQKEQDEIRSRQQRINELRAARGLPPNPR